MILECFGIACAIVIDYILQTRVLVTHGLTYLRQMDNIIVLRDGEISEIGTYKELLKHDGAFAEFLRTYLNELDESDSSDPDSECLFLYSFPQLVYYSSKVLVKK